MYDAHYALFELADGVFRPVADAKPLSKIIGSWSQDSFAGPRRLYYKRAVHLAGSTTESDELASTAAGNGPHRLAFVDCVYHFLHGHYRGDMPWVVSTAAWLLQCYAGDFKEARDSTVVMRSFIVELVPLFAVKGAEVPRTAARSHGVKASPLATSLDDMTQRVRVAYAALAGRTLLQAQKSFIKACKDSASYGCEFFTATHTWKESSASAGGKVAQTRTEDVIVAVGCSAILLMGTSDPHAITAFNLEDISKWTVDRAGHVFAFSLEDDSIKFLMTEAAALVEVSVERHVAERVRALTDTAEPVTPARTEKAVVSPIPTFVLEAPAPTPAFASSAAVSGSTSSSSASSGSSPGPLPDDVLPPEWKALTDADGDVYYWNEKTDETSWERPKAAAASSRAAADALPAGWEALKDEDGDTYYYNNATGESSWDRPRAPAAAAASSKKPSAAGLPPDWIIEYDDDGAWHVFVRGG